MAHSAPAYIVQDEHLGIVGASAGFSALVGHTPSEVVGHSLGDFIVDEDRRLFQRAQARYLQDRRNHRVVWRLARRGGGAVSVVITSAEVETDAGLRVIASFEEATGAKVFALPRSDGEATDAVVMARSFLNHQIASPLNSMRGLFSTCPPGDEASLVALLPKLSARLDRMVADAQALAREFVYLADDASGSVSVARDVVIARVSAGLKEAGVDARKIEVDVVGRRDVSVSLETLDAMVGNVVSLCDDVRGVGRLRIIFGQDKLYLFISAVDAPTVNLLQQARLEACTSMTSTVPIRERFLMCQLRAVVLRLGLQLTFQSAPETVENVVGAT